MYYCQATHWKAVTIRRLKRELIAVNNATGLQSLCEEDKANILQHRTTWFNE